MNATTTFAANGSITTQPSKYIVSKKSAKFPTFGIEPSKIEVLQHIFNVPQRKRNRIKQKSNEP